MRHAASDAGGKASGQRLGAASPARRGRLVVVGDLVLFSLLAGGACGSADARQPNASDIRHASRYATEHAVDVRARRPLPSGYTAAFRVPAGSDVKSVDISEPAGVIKLLRLIVPAGTRTSATGVIPDLAGVGISTPAPGNDPARPASVVASSLYAARRRRHVRCPWPHGAFACASFPDRPGSSGSSSWSERQQPIAVGDRAKNPRQRDRGWRRRSRLPCKPTAPRLSAPQAPTPASPRNSTAHEHRRPAEGGHLVSCRDGHSQPRRRDTSLARISRTRRYGAGGGTPAGRSAALAARCGARHAIVQDARVAMDAGLSDLAADCGAGCSTRIGRRPIVVVERSVDQVAVPGESRDRLDSHHYRRDHRCERDRGACGARAVGEGRPRPEPRPRAHQRS